MEESINLFLQSFSNGFTDAMALVLTELGDEMFFLLVAMILFWCVDKKFGYKLINVYLMGCVAMTGMKNLIKRPRPFKNGNVASIGAEESGYSFPSGHSHSIANLSTQTALKARKAWIIALGVCLTAVVMFTRLYLGQHYLSDVLAGCALGIIMAITLSWAFDRLGDNEDKIWWVVTPLCVVVAIVCTALKVENGQIYDVCGGYGAAAIAYYLEKRFVALDVKTVWWKQVLKLVFGAAVVLLLKEGLKAVFLATNITHALVYNFLRYAVVATAAFLLMPWLFKITGLCDDKKSTTSEKTK